MRDELLNLRGSFSRPSGSFLWQGESSPWVAPSEFVATFTSQLCHSEEARRGIYFQFGAKNEQDETIQPVDSSSFLLGMTKLGSGMTKPKCGMIRLRHRKSEARLS